MAGGAAPAGMLLGHTGATQTAAAVGVSRPHFPSQQKSCLDFFCHGNETKSCLYSASTPSYPNLTASVPGRHQISLFLPSGVYALSPKSFWSSCSSFIASGGVQNAAFETDLFGKFSRAGSRAGTSGQRNSRARGMIVSSMSGGLSEGALEDTIKGRNSQNPVVVYSKSWCPYCSMVKSLFKKLGVSFDLVELDELIDEQGVQDALTRLTGQSTVPNVFIGGKHIGGCDDTMALHKRGELVPALEATGLKITAA